MSAFPGSIDGRAPGARSPEWLVELSRQIDRFVGVSAGEARAVADGLRKSLSAERFEQALGALRMRWRREGTVNASELERALRIQARQFGLERTIEEWTRHTIGPPSIRV